MRAVAATLAICAFFIAVTVVPGQSSDSGKRPAPAVPKYDPGSYAELQKAPEKARNRPNPLQNDPDDLSRREVVQEIRGLDDQQRHELVALLWIGRGDFEPAEWDTAVQTAAEREETTAEHYLLGQPLVADYWAEGLSALGIEIPVGSVA